jgi:hypothetical protein
MLSTVRIEMTAGGGTSVTIVTPLVDVEPVLT